MRFLGSDGTSLDFSYRELQEQSNRFANLLRQLGVGKGDTVSVCTDRIPALYFAALGTLINISIFCPLFSSFGPEALYHRLKRGDARVLVTTTRLFQNFKHASLRFVVVVMDERKTFGTSLSSDTLADNHLESAVFA